jgi:hypothetical protein
MGAEDALKRIPKGDFLRVTGEQKVDLPHDKKIALIRKGNELFNEGKIDLARRIFLTTRYTDGLIRLGDYYYKKNQPLEALRMYYAAPYRQKTAPLVERMARILQEWLRED